MRKDSAIILLVSVLITTGVVGVAYYMSVVRHPSTDTFDYPANPQSSADAPETAFGTPEGFAATSTERTDTPIKCQHPDIGEYWTNAATCEGADLDNRLSHAAPLASLPYEDRYPGMVNKAPEREASDNREDGKPDLRLAGKSPPDGLPVECTFPVGKASETERMLAAADDPFESTWRDTYCEFRCEVIQYNCPIRDDFFYYNFEKMCRGTEHHPCYRKIG